MNLLNIAWVLIILLLIAFGLNFICNARVNNPKYKFYDKLIGLGMIVVVILVAVDLINK